jgi:DNA-binding NtrC family response regulator
MNSSPERVAIAHARILLVEDDQEMCRFLTELLTEEGYEVEVAYDGRSALEKYKQAGFDLTITDLMMPGVKGAELVHNIKVIDSDALVMVITAFGSIESAVELMRRGAFTYLTKPFRTDEILLNVSRALEQRGLRRELQRLRKEVQGHYGLENIIGKSIRMQHLFDMVAHVKDLSANVLITGESGTGKELVARAIHYNSIRARSPFVPVNCAAIPETLLESELFGYVRGAFTDAKKDHRGLFQEANGGTLFLDEISEVPLNLQAKLLRVIEDKEVRSLGATRLEKVDVRLLAATNRNLDELVRRGSFRQDLFYRLNVIGIHLCPLRERVDDIPLLVDHFIQKFAANAKRKIAGIAPDALNALLGYPWPGNVRELEHVVERAVLLGKEETITTKDLPPQVVNETDKGALLDDAASRRYTLKELEQVYISKILDETNGNKTEAANILGIDRTTLYRKLEEVKAKE